MDTLRRRRWYRVIDGHIGRGETGKEGEEEYWETVGRAKSKSVTSGV